MASNNLVAIVGRRGSGKTLLMTHYLHECYKAGRPVVANYSLQFPHRHMSLEDISKLPEDIDGSAVGLDELHVAADSRKIWSKANDSLTLLVTQMRKRRLTVYFTTQRFKNVDIRIREQTDTIIFVEPTKTDGVAKLHVYDGQTLELEKTFRFDGRQLFGLYDSWEVIEFSDVGNPSPIEETKRPARGASHVELNMDADRQKKDMEDEKKRRAMRAPSIF